MPLTAPQSTKKGFEAGVYDAICYSVLDIGTQENKFGTKHQIVIGWKFLEYTYEDGNNVSYHQTFTLSMNEKAKLREILQGWVLQGDKNPEAYDLSKLLGQGCKLILAPNANGTISAKSAIPNKVEEGQSVVTEYFSFQDWDGGELPKFLTEDRNQWKRERIQASEEYSAQQEKNLDHSNDSRIDNNNNPF
tara:strand:+ start:5030 stop:5602 length:573 start_codon:yes stop_codon:yes gene_type:complete